MLRSSAPVSLPPLRRGVHVTSAAQRALVSPTRAFCPRATGGSWNRLRSVLHPILDHGQVGGALDTVAGLLEDLRGRRSGARSFLGVSHASLATLHESPRAPTLVGDTQTLVSRPTQGSFLSFDQPILAAGAMALLGRPLSGRWTPCPFFLQLPADDRMRIRRALWHKHVRQKPLKGNP